MNKKKPSIPRGSIDGQTHYGENVLLTKESKYHSDVANYIGNFLIFVLINVNKNI